MNNWTAEIKELEKIVLTLSGQRAELEKELFHLIEAKKEVVLLLYSRRSLEVLVRNICEDENINISDTIPLKGIIDKLNKEQKVPSNIITSMLNLNSSSVYGAHPKEFDSGQVRTTLINLTSILKWFINLKKINSPTQHLSQSISLPLSQTQSQPRLKKSIIVLPFENMSPDPDQEYFSEGLTEEIITDLSYINELLVISRSSAMTFKGSKLTIKEIAQKVKVTHVLEGSVRKAGNNLRITAQLIEAESDTHLWAEKYNGTLDDVFEIQEKVAGSIAEKLRVHLSSEEKERLSKRKYESVLVYDYYFKAIRTITSSFSEEKVGKVIKDLNAAIEIVGEQSLLYSTIAFAYWTYLNIGFYNEEYAQKAEYYAQKALQLDSDSAMPYIVLSIIHHILHANHKKGLKYVKRAYEIDPNNILAITVMLNSYVPAGKMEASLPLVQKMNRIDPLSFTTRWYQGAFNYYSGEFEAALNESAKTIEMYPENAYGLYEHCVILAFNGKYKEAIHVAEKMQELNQGTIFEKLALILKYALLGKPGKMDELLTLQNKETITPDFGYSNQLAGFYCIANQKQKAYEWLEISMKAGFFNYPFLNEYCPFFKNIRNEDRFKQFMQKVKYEWENFEA